MGKREKYMFGAGIFLCMLLAGCVNSTKITQKNTDTSVSTQAQLPTQVPTSTETPTLTVTLEPTATPMLTDTPEPTEIPTPKMTPVPVTELDLGDDEVLHTLCVLLENEEYTIYAIGKKREDMDVWGVRELLVYVGAELRQAIAMQVATSTDGVDGIDVGYTECWQAESTVAVRDVNFDGYPDLEVFGWCPNNSIPYYYWCWNPETKQFDYAFCLQLTGVDEENKHLISYQKVGGGVYYTEYYRVAKDNTLELAERMTEDYRIFAHWSEAYRDVINSFPDNLLNPSGLREESCWSDTEKYMYLGTHDFDVDGIPELVIGDGASLAVFTLQNGQIKKCADLTMQCCESHIDAVACRDNAILAECYGEDGSVYTVLAYRDGAWVTSVYCEVHPESCTIHGQAATYEVFCKTAPFDTKNWEESVQPYHIRLQYIGFPLNEGFELEEFY